MNNRGKTGSLIVGLTVFIISIVFIIITLDKPKISITLSIVLFLFPVLLLVFKKLDIKKAVLFFIFIYPLLPCLAGFQIADGIPVLRAHRMLTMVLIMFLIYKDIFLEYHKNFYKNNIYSIIIIFISLSYFITIILTENKSGTLNSLLSLHLENIILSVVVYNTFKDMEDIDNLIRVFCYSILFLAVLGIYEKVTEYNVFTVFGVFDPQYNAVLQFQMRYGEIRINGPFDHSIAFGAFFACTLPLLMYHYRNREFMFNISMFLIFLNILNTQSRAGLIGFLLVIFLYLLFGIRKNLRLALFLFFVFIIPNIGAIFERYWEIDASLQSPYLQSERSKQFYYLMGYIKDNIFFGYGQTQYLPMMRGRLDGGEGNYQSTMDNYYLLYTYFWGFIGLFLYSVLIGTPFYQSIRHFKSAIFKNNLLIMLLIGIIVFTVINTVVALWSFHFIFWIYLGIIARLIMIQKEGKNAVDNYC